jgi:large subunit ribosomal protein L22
MENKYGFQGFNGEHMVSAIGRNLPISTKQSIEISNFIRGKPANKAAVVLERVMKKDIAVPYKRFNADVGHKPGIAAGRYPIKACGEILKVLKNAIANAQFKGMNADDLLIRHIATQKASGAWHFGRKRRRKMKRSHLELVLEEVAKKKDKKSGKKEVITQKTTQKTVDVEGVVDAAKKDVKKDNKKTLVPAKSEQAPVGAKEEVESKVAPIKKDKAKIIKTAENNQNNPKENNLDDNTEDDETVEFKTDESTEKKIGKKTVPKAVTKEESQEESHIDPKTQEKTSATGGKEVQGTPVKESELSAEKKSEEKGVKVD